MKLTNSLLFLYAFITARVKADSDDNRPFLVERDLSGLPCNVPLYTMSLAEVQTALVSTFTFKRDILGVLEASSIIDDKIPLTEYDVQVMKICSSCVSQNLSGYGCNENDYGSDTNHSGMLMIPVVKGSSEVPNTVINAKRLKPWFQFGGGTVSPVDNSKQTSEPGFNNYEYALLAASCGHVSIMSSKTGYDEAGGLVMSDLNRKSAVTQTIPLFYKADEIIQAMSDQKTKLSKKAVFMGYSGGGYQAVAAADGMADYGIRPIHVLAGGAPFKVKSWLLQGYYRSASENSLSPIAPFTLGLVGVSFSGPREDVSNYPDQSLLKPDKVERLIQLYKDQSAPSLYLDAEGWLTHVAINYADLFADQSFLDPNLEDFFVDAFESQDEDPCSKETLPENVDGNCAALIANDLEEVLVNADYPIDLCHSKEDEIVVYENTIESLTTYQLEGLTHGEAYAVCAAAVFNGYTIEKPDIRTTTAQKQCSDNDELSPICQSEDHQKEY